MTEKEQVRKRNSIQEDAELKEKESEEVKNEYTDGSEEDSIITNSELDESIISEKDVESPRKKSENPVNKILREKRKYKSNSLLGECCGEMIATLCTGLIVLGGIGLSYLAKPTYDLVMNYFSGNSTNS